MKPTQQISEPPTLDEIRRALAARPPAPLREPPPRAAAVAIVLRPAYEGLAVLFHPPGRVSSRLPLGSAPGTTRPGAAGSLSLRPRRDRVEPAQHLRGRAYHLGADLSDDRGLPADAGARPEIGGCCRLRDLRRRSCAGRRVLQRPVRVARMVIRVASPSLSDARQHEWQQRREEGRRSCQRRPRGSPARPSLKIGTGCGRVGWCAYLCAAPGIGGRKMPLGARRRDEWRTTRSCS